MIDRIYLDVDQVLADWSGGLYRLLGVDEAAVLQRLPEGEWDVCGSLPGYTKNAAWRHIDAAGEEFWANLDLLPWALDLFALAESIAPTYLLTSPSMHPSSYSGKARWIQTHFGSRFRNMLIGSAKSECAKPGRVLIDDRPKNCTSFRAAGGSAILFPAQGNTNAEHLSDPLSFVHALLAAHM